jgi:hypothetical protein
MPTRTPAQQLRVFLAKFEPLVAASARSALSRLRKRLTEIVYDNYNALAIGFGPSDKASEAIFSIAVFPRWVSLFFLQGAKLPDPDGLLKGTGTKARHIVLAEPPCPREIVGQKAHDPCHDIGQEANRSPSAAALNH